MHTNKLEEKKHDNQVKQKAKTGDLSDTGVVSDQNQGTESTNGDHHEDSFQRLYSKELDLDEDEVPIILHELNDSAIHFISRDQYERALSLLQKAQTLIDRLQFQRNPNDRFIVLLTMHNMALCFQKLGALEECALCLEASLQSINSPFLLPKFQGDPSRKLKKLKYECKAHMQVCALLSQLHRHKEALQHAEKSVMIAQYMIADLLQMCQHYYFKVISAKKNEQIAQELIMMDENNQNGQQQNRDLIYYDDSVSMLERTAYRILPIIQEVASRMVKRSDQVEDKELLKRVEISELMKLKLNMKAVLGYLNQSEWLYLLNIGNIMQITPLTVHDLYSNTNFEIELTRDSILEKISFLAVSYFCISTELRFLVQIKDDPAIDPIRKKRESEFWHAKALEISCSFLPSESPLVSHILTSYNKHHAPVQHGIPEDQESVLELKVIRPLPGIDICKFQPIVRQDEALNISIASLPLSPNNYFHKARKISQDNPHQRTTTTTQQLLSLPISPNNQGIPTANASQNHLFQSQIVTHKNQTTDSQSTATQQNGTSQRQTNSTLNNGSIQQQQKANQNRFNKNKNSNSGQAANANSSQEPRQSAELSQDSEVLNANRLSQVQYQKLINDFSNINGQQPSQAKSNPQHQLSQFSGLSQLQQQQLLQRYQLQQQLGNLGYAGDQDEEEEDNEEIEEEDVEVYEDKEQSEGEEEDNGQQDQDKSGQQSRGQHTRNSSQQQQQQQQNTSLLGNSKHQESQEVEIVMEQVRNKRGSKAAAVNNQGKLNQSHQQQNFTKISRPLSGSSANRRSIKGSSKMSKNKNMLQPRERSKHSVQQQHQQLQNQVLDISQDNIDGLEVAEDDDKGLEEDDFYEHLEVGHGNQSLDDLLEARASHSRSKQQNRMQSNLSMDGARMKRPQTSQGVRKSNLRQLNKSNMLLQQDSATNNTMRQQTLPQQSELKAIKHNSALGVIPSADGPSPNNAAFSRAQILESRQNHNKSAAAANAHSSNFGGQNSRAQIWQANMLGSANGAPSTDSQSMATPNKERASAGRLKATTGSTTAMPSAQNRYSRCLAAEDPRTLKSNEHELEQIQASRQIVASQQRQLIQQQNLSSNQKTQLGGLDHGSNQHNRSQFTQNLAQFSIGLNQSLTQANSHNHSQILTNNSRQEVSRQINQLNQKTSVGGGATGVSQTSQGFYKPIPSSSQIQNSQIQKQLTIQGPQRSNSQQSRKNQSQMQASLNNSSIVSANHKNLASNTIVEGGSSSQSKNKIQQMQIQQAKFMTAQTGGNQDNSTLKEDQQLNPKKTLQDIFMIDRLAKKRAKGSGLNTHDQSIHSGLHNQSFEQFMGLNSSALNDSAINPRHLQNSNSRSKSRSKLTSSRSKEKSHSQIQKMKITNFNSHTSGSQSVLNSSALIGGQSSMLNGMSGTSNNNTSIFGNMNLINGANEMTANDQNSSQAHIEDLKRQILMKQALLVDGANSKNSRRKSTGNLNQSIQQHSQQQLLQNNQMKKKRVDNANNQSMRIDGVSSNHNNSLHQTQSSVAQLNQTASKSNQNPQGSGSNTQIMIKKFLKDRQSQQSTQILNTNNNFLVVNGNYNSGQQAFFQPLPSQQNSVMALTNLNNSDYVASNYASGSNSVLQPDLSSYKMQLSKKIMAQQQKLLGVISTQNKPLASATNLSLNEAQMQQNQILRQQRNAAKNTHLSGGGVNVSSKNLKGQYATEPHPKVQQQQQSQVQRSATPIFEMYDMSGNGMGSRTQKTINQSNSLGMYMSNLNQGSNKDKSLIDIGNIKITKANNARPQNQMMMQNFSNQEEQSMREESFSKSAKKKNSKKITPKNVIANNQFSWLQ